MNNKTCKTRKNWKTTSKRNVSDKPRPPPDPKQGANPMPGTYADLIRRLHPQVIDGNWDPQQNAWLPSGRSCLLAKIAHALGFALGNTDDRAQGLKALAHALNTTPAHVYAHFVDVGCFMGNARSEAIDITNLNAFWTRLEAAGPPPASLYEKCLALAPLDGTNLSGLDLRSVSFYGASLRAVNFDGADLRDASFTNAVLDSATFRGANLRQADFYHASMPEADFSGADVSNTIFDQAAYPRAVFAGARVDAVAA